MLYLKYIFYAIFDPYSFQEFKEVCRNLNKEQIEAAFKRFDQTGKTINFA